MAGNSRLNRSETAVVAVVGAALTGSAALMGLYLSKRNQRATRRATLRCACGKVRLEVHQPAANYKYAEPTNLQCACRDCMGYCRAVLKEGSADDAFRVDFFDPGTPILLLYDSEITVASGQEQLEHMKLTPRTENRRVHAKCCATPIAICPDHSHVNFLFANIVRPSDDGDCAADEVPFPASILKRATCCLHAGNLDESVLAKAKIQHPSMKLPPSVSVLEMLKIVSRLGLLLVMGARGPGDGIPVGPGKTVAIGYDSIPQSMK